MPVKMYRAVRMKSVALYWFSAYTISFFICASYSAVMFPCSSWGPGREAADELETTVKLVVRARRARKVRIKSLYIKDN